MMFCIRTSKIIKSQNFLLKKFTFGHFPKWYKNHYNDPNYRWIKSSYSNTFLLFYIVKTMGQKKLKIHFDKRHYSPKPKKSQNSQKMKNPPYWLFWKILCMKVFHVFLDAILIFEKLISFSNFTIFLANCIIWKNGQRRIFSIKKFWVLTIFGVLIYKII